MTDATNDPHPSTDLQSEEANDAASTSHARYDFSIDLDSNSTHATVVDLVGTDKRVLELGPATGYMSKVLRARGCSVVGIEIDAEMASVASTYCDRVVVADIDSVDLQKELGDDRYDVIVAADVLEHLTDPLGALQRLAAFLTVDSGYFVVSLPNVAHGSVRLALLEGRFPYQDLGLLDSTHLRFFTRESLERLVDDADLIIAELHRKDLNIDASEVPFDAASVPDDLLRRLADDPDAQTYQFIFKAYPLSRPGLHHIQQLFRQQAHELEQVGGQLANARRELEAANRLTEKRQEIEAALQQQMREFGGREAELRAALVEAHDQLLRRDVEFKRLIDQLEDTQQAARDQVQAKDGEITARDNELHMLRVRLSRITESLPVRAWRRVGRLPLLRGVVAQRTAGYKAALDRDASNP